jgi:hypothetical protein
MALGLSPGLTQLSNRYGSVMATLLSDLLLLSDEPPARLSAAAPQLPVLGLVDWNPDGVCILATYKFGNPRMGLEGARWAAACLHDLLSVRTAVTNAQISRSTPPPALPPHFHPTRHSPPAPRFALPRLRWLGVTSSMLSAVPRGSFHPLTPRDAALLPGLRRRLAGHRGWLDELQEMEEQVGGAGGCGMGLVLWVLCVAGRLCLAVPQTGWFALSNNSTPTPPRSKRLSSAISRPSTPLAASRGCTASWRAASSSSSTCDRPAPAGPFDETTKS